MEITRQADYAIRCVLEAARHERISAAAIATRQELSRSLVAKIVGTLGRAEILETQRGASGGVRLARDPEAISVLEVIEAVQGPIRLNRCVRNPPACRQVSICPVSPVIREAQAALLDALSVTFDEVLAREDRLLAGAGDRHPGDEPLMTAPSGQACACGCEPSTTNGARPADRRST